MSNDEDIVPRPKVEMIGDFDPDGTLARKLAKLQAINTSGFTKAAEAIAVAQKAASPAAAIVASMQQSTAHLDVGMDTSEHVREMFAANTIRWENMPEARRTRAAEETAEALKLLVDAALVAQAKAVAAEARAEVAEERETQMLELTVTNTRISKVAAVSGVVGVAVGVLGIIVAVLLAFLLS